MPVTVFDVFSNIFSVCLRKRYIYNTYNFLHICANKSTHQQEEIRTIFYKQHAQWTHIQIKTVWKTKQRRKTYTKRTNKKDFCGENSLQHETRSTYHNHLRPFLDAYTKIKCKFTYAISIDDEIDVHPERDRKKNKKKRQLQERQKMFYVHSYVQTAVKIV